MARRMVPRTFLALHSRSPAPTRAALGSAARKFSGSTVRRLHDRTWPSLLRANLELRKYVMISAAGPDLRAVGAQFQMRDSASPLRPSAQKPHRQKVALPNLTLGQIWRTDTPYAAVSADCTGACPDSRRTSARPGQAGRGPITLGHAKRETSSDCSNDHARCLRRDCRNRATQILAPHTAGISCFDAPSSTRHCRQSSIFAPQRTQQPVRWAHSLPSAWDFLWQSTERRGRSASRHAHKCSKPSASATGKPSSQRSSTSKTRPTRTGSSTSSS